MPCPTYDPYDKDLAAFAQNDCYLLKAIGALHHLSTSTDVSQSIYADAVSTLLDTPGEFWQSKGRSVCQKLGIKDDASYDANWYTHVQNTSS